MKTNNCKPSNPTSKEHFSPMLRFPKYRLVIIKTLLFIILFFGISTIVNSQSVSNIEPLQTGNKISINYSIISAKFNQTFIVTLYVSNDGGQNFQGPVKSVTGDVGKVVSGGKKKILWDVFKDDINIEGDLVFDVRIEVFEEKIKKKFFLAFSGNTSAPFGLSIGQIGKIGWYITARTNQNFNLSSSYECNNEQITNYSAETYYSFDGESKIVRFSLTAGLTYQAGKNVYFYAGGGYGTKDLLWHINEYDYDDDSKTGDDYAKNTNYSYSGIETEAGIIINTGSFFFSAGASSQSFKRLDGNFSIGLTF